MSESGQVIRPGTLEWLEARRKYICASDAPKILGFSRWGKPIDVCLEKWGESEQGPPTEYQERGLILEEAVGCAYEFRTGRKLSPSAFVVHPKNKWMAATPDGFVDGEKRHAQIKTHNLWTVDEYGPDGSREFPEAELVQVLHELEVTGNEQADLVVLFSVDDTFRAFTKLVRAGKLLPEALGEYIAKELDFRIYPIEADPETQEAMVEAEKEFYDKFVVAREVPPDAPTRKDSGDIRKATAEEVKLIEELKIYWLGNYRADQELEDAKAKVVRAIGADAGIDAGNGEKVTYKKNKDSTEDVVDWKAVAKDVNVPQEIIDQNSKRVSAVSVDWEKAVRESPTIAGMPGDVWEKILADHTETKVTRKGTRTFRVPHQKWKKEA